MTDDAEVWPEFAEWQELALKERDFWFARGYQGLSDEEVDAILGPIEERLSLLEQQMRAKPFRGALVDAMALAIIALRHQEIVGPGATKFDGSIKAIYDEDVGDRSIGDLLRNVCMLAQTSGLFPILANANFDPHPDLKLLDIAECFREGSPVMDKIVEMRAEEALGLSARTPAGVRVKMQALAYLSGKRVIKGLPEKLRELEQELASVAA